MASGMLADSGYASAEDETEIGIGELEELENHVWNEIEDRDVNFEQMREANFMFEKDKRVEDADNDDESFQDWLRKVAECLEGRKKGDPEKMDPIVKENLTEEERCMKVARSVLDEETVLEMVKTFLNFTKVIFTSLVCYIYLSIVYATNRN